MPDAKNDFMNFLSEQKRTQLKAQHRLERDGRIQDRIKAVLLFDEGWTPQQGHRYLRRGGVQNYLYRCRDEAMVKTSQIFLQKRNRLI